MRQLLTLTATLSLIIGLFGQAPLRTYQVQGTGIASPFVGQLVQLDTVQVVAAGPGFAYVQDRFGDGNPDTSDGLLLDNSSLGTLTPGQLLVAAGIVRELDGQTALAGPNFSFTILGTAPLPAPLSFQVSSEYMPVPDLERLEGMLLSFTATVGGPSFNGDADIYVSGSRPFREPGIRAPGQSGLPVFDGNPQLIVYDPNEFGETDNRFLNAGASFGGQGVLFQDGCCYVLSPTEPVNYTTFDPSTAVRAAQDDEISIGSLNLLNLDAGDESYPQRLDKISDYISAQLNFPQILAVQEAWGSQELNALAFRLRQLDGNRGDYRVYLGSGTGSISNGFLVWNGLPEPDISELGTNEFLSIGGILHDRPPLLLDLQINDANQTQLQVLNLHLRSLNGIEGSNANFVRTKRHEQAISVAEMVENLRDENLVIVGDYNAFEFTDGYVDVLSQIGGYATLGAQRSPLDIVNPPLDHLSIELLPEDERYSFVFQGSAQLLDHCLSNSLDGLTTRELQFARGNADAASAYFSNPFTTFRSSDHDGFVLFLGIDAVSSTASPAHSRPDLRFPNPFTVGSTVDFPAELRNARVQILDQLGRPMTAFVSLDADYRLPQVGHQAEGRMSWVPNFITDYRGPGVLQLAWAGNLYAWPMIIN